MANHLDAVSAPRVNTPVGGAPTIPIIFFAAGGYLLWFGVHYFKDGTTKWPTDPVKAALTGKPVPKPVKATTAGNQATLAADIKGIQPDPSSSGGGTPSTGTTPGQQGGTAAQNQAIAKLIAANYGWSTGANWDALVSLWNSESGWSNTIWNTSASCGNNAYAYGIPQSCGHGDTKTIPGHGGVCPFPAGNAGNPPECGGTSDAGAQITWGFEYIKGKYGAPVNVPHGGY